MSTSDRDFSSFASGVVHDNLTVQWIWPEGFALVFSLVYAPACLVYVFLFFPLFCLSWFRLHKINVIHCISIRWCNLKWLWLPWAHTLLSWLKKHEANTPANKTKQNKTKLCHVPCEQMKMWPCGGTLQWFLEAFGKIQTSPFERKRYKPCNVWGLGPISLSKLDQFCFFYNAMREFLALWWGFVKKKIQTSVRSLGVKSPSVR